MITDALTRQKVLENIDRSRKTIVETTRYIITLTKRDPFILSAEIYNQIKTNITSCTIRRQISKKKSYIEQKEIKERIEFVDFVWFR